MSRIISTRNQKAKLAADYNELLKELSSYEMNSVGYYQLGETIGEGSFGKVKLGTHKLTGQSVAIKRIHKKHAPMIAREIHHHRRLRHPNIVTLYEIIITESYIHVISEYCPNGELFDALAACGRCSESRARKWFQQLVSAIKYCHTQGIIHRDLKLENILLDDQDNAKLCDFGFARQADHRQLLETFCGSLAYSAPEVIERQKYSGPETDIWSLGVVLYTLLAGELPFDDDSEIITQRKIVRVAYEMPFYFSPDAADLIRSMLQKNPSDRLSLDQIIAHPWFQQVDHPDWASLNSPITPNSSHSDADSLFSVGRGRPHDDDDACTDLSSYDSYTSDHKPSTPKADRIMSPPDALRFSPQVRNSLGITVRSPRSPRFSAPTTLKPSQLLSSPSSPQRSSLPNMMPSHNPLTDYYYGYDGHPMTAKELKLAAALTAAGVEQSTVKEMRTTGACDALNGLWNILLEKTSESSSIKQLCDEQFEAALLMQHQQRMSLHLPLKYGRTKAHAEDACVQTDPSLQRAVDTATQTVVSATPSSPRPLRTAPRASGSSYSSSDRASPGSLDKQHQTGWLATTVKSWFTTKPTSESRSVLAAQHQQQRRQQRRTSKSFRNVDAPLPHKEGRRYWDDATVTTEQQEKQHELYRNASQKYRLHSLQLAEPPVAQVDQLAYSATQFGPTAADSKRSRQSVPRYPFAKATAAQEGPLIVPPVARTLVKSAPLVDVDKRYSTMMYPSLATVELVSVPPVAASSGTTVQHNEKKPVVLNSTPAQQQQELQPRPTSPKPPLIYSPAPSPVLSASSPSSLTCSSDEEEIEKEQQHQNNISLPVLSLPPSEKSFIRQTKLANNPPPASIMALHSKRADFIPRSRLNVYGMNSNTNINSFASKAIIEEEEE